MSKFRKKPVTIEAQQLTSDNAGALVAWITSTGQKAVMRGGPRGGSKNATLIIETLESDRHLVEVGDFVIRGVRGEHYSCKPNIFAETYEPVG